MTCREVDVIMAVSLGYTKRQARNADLYCTCLPYGLPGAPDRWVATAWHALDFFVPEQVGRTRREALAALAQAIHERFGRPPAERCER